MKSSLKATVLSIVTIFGTTLTGCAQGPLVVDQKQGTPPIATYTPQITGKLNPGEHLALYLFLSPTNVTLDAAVASSGGDGVAYSGPMERECVFFSTVVDVKERNFLGYKFRVFDTDDKLFSNGKVIRVRIFGPSGSSQFSPQLNWDFLQPTAKVSAALGVFKEEGGDYRFLRFASAVSTTIFKAKD